MRAKCIFSKVQNLFVLLFLGASLLLVGCGAKSGGSSGAGQSSSSSSAPPTHTAAPTNFSGTSFVDLNLQATAQTFVTPGNRMLSAMKVSQSIRTGAVLSDGLNRQISGGIYFSY